MVRIECESFEFDCPDFAGPFVGSEALEHLQPAAEVIGVDEVEEVGLELPPAVVMGGV